MKTFLYGWVLLLLFSGCHNINIEPPYNQSPTATVGPLAQQPYAINALAGLQQKFSLPAGKYAPAPDWVPTPWGLVDTAHVLTLQKPGGRPFYTFTLQPATGSSNRQKLLLYPYAQGSKGLLLTYAPDADWNGRPPFQGTLTIQDLEQQVINVIYMAGGVATPVAAKQGTANRGIFAGSLEAESCLTDVNLIEVCNGGEESTATGIALPEELQECYQTIELVYETCNANTVGAPGISQGTLPGTPLPSGGGSGSSGPGTTTPLPPEEPTEPILTGDVLDLNDLALDIWVEEQIFDLQLDNCMKEVLNDIKELDSGVANVLKAFDKELALYTNYNWVVASTDTLSSGNVAVTIGDYDNVMDQVTTVFNRNSFRNASDLAIVIVLLHEAIHAHLVVNQHVNEDIFEMTYPELFNEMTNGLIKNEAHHNEMAKRFVEPIAAALKEYGSIKNYNIPYKEYYEDLAWGGLQGTQLFHSLPLERKLAIFGVYDAEFNINGNLTQEQVGVDGNCN